MMMRGKDETRYNVDLAGNPESSVTFVWNNGLVLRGKIE